MREIYYNNRIERQFLAVLYGRPLNETQPAPRTWWFSIHRWLNPKRMRYPYIAGGAIMLAWLVSILLGPGLLDLAGTAIGADYLQFYTAGLTLRLGQEARL